MTYQATFDSSTEAHAAQKEIAPLYNTGLTPEPFNGWLLTVYFPDDGSGSQHVNPERFDMVVEAVLSHGGKPVEPS